MKTLACEKADGSLIRLVLNETLLGWMKSGRTPAEVRATVDAFVAQGFALDEVMRYIESMQDRDREILNRTKAQVAPDGTVIAPGWPLELATEWADALSKGGLTEPQALDLLARTGVRDVVRWIEVPPIAPALKDYRSAYKIVGTTLVPDMPKAREIHKTILRIARKQKFAALDVEYMRADEAGDTVKKASIAAQKQALRDITTDPRITNATTIEELMLVQV